MARSRGSLAGERPRVPAGISRSSRRTSTRYWRMKPTSPTSLIGEHRDRAGVDRDVALEALPRRGDGALLDVKDARPKHSRRPLRPGRSRSQGAVDRRGIDDVRLATLGANGGRLDETEEERVGTIRT